MHGTIGRLIFAGALVALFTVPLYAADDESDDRPPAKATDDNPPRRRPDPPPDGTGREGRRPPAAPLGEGPRPAGAPHWNDRHRGPGPGEGPPHDGHGPDGAPGPRWHHRMGDMRPFDPEMAKLYEEDSELDRLTRDLGDRYQKAKESERAEVLTKLKAAVVKHFEIRQQRRELELKRLEEQLDRLRSSMKRRGEQQDEIIKQRVDELIGKPDDLGF